MPGLAAWIEDGRTGPVCTVSESLARRTMPNALTPDQLEILRRIRDDVPLLSEPRIRAPFSELGFLLAFDLVEVHGSTPLRLSALGQAYLDEAGREAAENVRTPAPE
jgi:hypothetical protein